MARVLFEATIVHAGSADLAALNSLSEEAAPVDGPTPLTEVTAERVAVQRRLSADLLRIYRMAYTDFEQGYRTTEDWWRGAVSGQFPHVLEAHFGGHFFGFQQARDLDWLQYQIGRLMDNSTRVAGQALLLATASTVAAAPGKQFAQPLNFLADPPTDFVVRRLISDRSRDVRTTFRVHLAQLGAHGRPQFSDSSEFERKRLPQALAHPSGTDLVYADPPYTGDEYSRFYHVLNLIAENRPFRLTLVDEKPTKGRYPTSRIPSVFCNRTSAPQAFGDLIDWVGRIGARFVLSYSEGTINGSRGRTVSLETLTELCESQFSSVTVAPLAHSYRPLQPRARAAPSATEYAVICR